MNEYPCGSCGLNLGVSEFWKNKANVHREQTSNRCIICSKALKSAKKESEISHLKARCLPVSVRIGQFEQAENMAQQERDLAISRRQKPPEGMGPQYCQCCDEEIPAARRLAYGNGICIDCATAAEFKKGGSM